MKTLTLLFLIREDEVLLAMKKRGFGEGRYNGVGGKIEPGETLEQALIRECQEEIMVTPLIYDEMAVIEFDEQHLGKRENLKVHVFTCTKWHGQPKETEEMEPRWFSKSSLPFNEMWADDPYWLPKILAGKKIKARFTLGDKDQIIDQSIEEI